MATRTHELVEGVRAVIGDTESPYRYPDATVLSALFVVFRGGQMPGHALSGDRLSVTPDLVDAKWLLTVLLASLTFVRISAEGSSYTRRALSERFEGQKDLLRSLEMDIEILKGGGGFLESWVDLASWKAGMSGAQYWERLYKVRVEDRGTVNLGASSSTELIVGP